MTLSQKPLLIYIKKCSDFHYKIQITLSLFKINYVGDQNIPSNMWWAIEEQLWMNNMMNTVCSQITYLKEEHRFFYDKITGLLSTKELAVNHWIQLEDLRRLGMIPEKFSSLRSLFSLVSCFAYLLYLEILTSSAFAFPVLQKHSAISWNLKPFLWNLLISGLSH